MVSVTKKDEQGKAQNYFIKSEFGLPLLMWFSGSGVVPQSESSLVQFPFRVLAWVVGQVPSRGHVGGS